MAFSGHLGFCQCPGGLVGPACSGLPSLVLGPKADFPESPGAVGAVEPADSRQGRGLTKGAGTGTDPLPEPSAARACCWGAGSALRADLGTHWSLGSSPQANAAGGEIQREFKARGPPMPAARGDGCPSNWAGPAGGFNMAEGRSGSYSEVRGFKTAAWQRELPLLPSDKWEPASLP